MTPEVSVIVCSIDPAKLARMRASYERALATVVHEIIAFTDARSLAEAYNRGIDRARGRILVFSHDDVEILIPDLGAALARHLAAFDLVGIAGTTRLIGGGWYFAGHPFDFMLVVSPHPESGRLTVVVEGGGPVVVPGVQALDGVFLAARAELARELRFDDTTFDHFHLYDLDFSFRAHLAGAPLAVCRDLVLIHRSIGRYDAHWDENRQRFEAKFAGKLARPLPRREPRILNIPLDDAQLADPQSVALLCATATIEGMLARLGPATER